MDMKSIVVNCKGDAFLFQAFRETITNIMKGDKKIHAFQTLKSVEVFNFVENPIQHMSVETELITAWTKTHIIEIYLH